MKYKLIFTVKKEKFIDLKFLLPIFIMIIIILSFVIRGSASLKTFWIAGVMALFAQFFLEKDKKFFGKKCVNNLKDDTLLSCTIIFILAGILSSVLKNAGVSDALLMLCSSIGLDARFLPLIIFSVCCIFSTACGTSTGTIAMAVPVFLSLSVSLGCNPALILGAIVSGSFFGDNLSPISDTTVISVNTMNVDLYSTIKKRAKISFLTFFISSIIYIVLGCILIEKRKFNVEVQGNYISLVFLLIPIVMIIFLSKTKEVIPTLILSDFLAIFISLALRLTTVKELFGKESIIIQGIESVFGVIAFWIFLFVIIKFIPKSFFERKLKNSDIISENDIFFDNLRGVLMIIFSILLVSNNTAAMSMMSCVVGDFFKNKNKVDKANIFDGLSCAIPGILPYNTAFMLMLSLSFESGCLPENFSVAQIPLFSINSFCLLIFYMYIALKRETKKLLNTRDNQNINKN